MPSVILTNASGGQLLFSGNMWSGVMRPVGGVQFRADRANSGNIYVGLSGNLTIKSGDYPLSGGAYSGGLDGMQVGPGDAYFLPAIAFANKGGASSGVPNIYVGCDAAASGGFARLYYETF